MKLNKSQKALFGLFLLGGIMLFIITIFLIGSSNNIFSSSIRIKTYFNNASGLKPGSIVTLSGINIGYIDEINIISSDSLEFVLSVSKSKADFIKKDSKASIVSEGLVGNKIIEISSGSSSSPSVSNNDVINSVKPVSIDEILYSLNQSGKNSAELTQNLSEIVKKINAGEGTMGQLINNESLYKEVENTLKGVSDYSAIVNRILLKVGNTVDNLSGDLSKLTGNIDGIVKDILEITDKFNSNKNFAGILLTDTAFAGSIKSITETAKKTALNLERGAFSFNQNMEALKHNFFFKGYFEDIGYWDKEDYEKSIDKQEKLLREKEKELRILRDSLKIIQERILKETVPEK